MAILASTMTAAAPLSQRRILLFWLPLAASWLLMGSEAPLINAALARMPAAATMIAAFGIVGSLSITIESPVIMLLATSTALARSRQNYLRLRQFTLHLMLATTLLHVLVGWTPLFDVIVADMMQVPASLLDPVRLGMRLMVFWSAAIAWRRFKQGVLIRYGQTRSVGIGSAIRLVASAGLAITLALTTQLAGIAVAALALTVGVLVEATYAHWVARPLIERRFGESAPASTEPDLSYAELVRFHTPLAASTLLFLLTQPMISAALARLPDPETVLAAWPVAAGLLFVTRAPALALPEVIIALIDEKDSRPALRKFSLRVGAAGFIVLALLTFTPLAHFYYRTLIGVTEQLANLAASGAQVAVLLPLVMAWQSWFRGRLTARRATSALTVAMMVNLATMAVVLAAGVALRLPGVLLAGLALTLASGTETATLWLAHRRLKAAELAEAGR